MKTLYFLLVSLTLSGFALAQKMYFMPNISGTFRITYNDTLQDNLELVAGQIYEIDLTQMLHIEFADNEATTAYKFSNAEFQEKDTLYLDFIQYYTADTIHYVSDCLDGSKSKTKTSVVKQNRGSKPIDELPENIALRMSNREIECKKVVNGSLIASSGSGSKRGKKWGYFKGTSSYRITYVSTID